MISKKKILIVEDDPDMRLLIQAALEADEHLTIAGEAESYQQALESQAVEDATLVILDHSINGSTTGLQAAPLIKKVAPRAKILLFTAYDMEAQVRDEPSIDAYLRKDDFGRLLSVVRLLLGL